MNKATPLAADMATAANRGLGKTRLTGCTWWRGSNFLIIKFSFTLF